MRYGQNQIGARAFLRWWSLWLVVGASTYCPRAHAEALDEVIEPSCPEGDADGDGICDDVEIRTGTSPYDEDTDGDGVPDGVEDANRDGIVDPGESDPRVPGLFPGSPPYIPEPMVFDLVRPLGAKRGEIEANTLAVVRFHRDRPRVMWAPEIEWAFADGFAAELELPIHDLSIEALKMALQATLPASPRSFVHGIQVIGEYLLASKATEVTALYLAGARAGAWSVFMMVGARATTPMQTRAQFEAIINPSLYYDASERFSAGIEGNVAIGLTGRSTGAVIPQAHIQLARHLRVQFGGGIAVEDGEVYPIIVSRLIVE